MSTDKNLSGAALGQYEIKGLLGVGAMGAVYRAFQPSLKRDVAVKVLTASALTMQKDYAERFSREAQTAAALEHPNIVPIYDYGTADGTPFVVMRLLTGGSLEDRIQQSQKQDKPLPTPVEIADLLKQLASALDYAHSSGVVHRDIKPSNIMFDSRGVPFVVDFGIVRLLNNKSTLTMSGFIAGTPPYIPPEQWMTQDAGPAADQYALGVIVYSLLSGKLPFDSPTIYQLIQMHINEPPPPLHDEQFNAVVMRALSKDPSDRYPTVSAFAQAFSEVAAAYQTGMTGTGFFTMALPDRSSSNKVPVPGFLMTTAERPLYKTPSAIATFIVTLLLVLAVIGFSWVGLENQANDNATRAASTAVALEGTQTAVAVGSLPTPTVDPAMIAGVIAECQAQNPPPGRQGLIAFYSNSDNSRYDLYVMNADGSNTRRLTNFNAENPRQYEWSGDGRYLLFSAAVDGRDDIFTVDVTDPNA